MLRIVEVRAGCPAVCPWYVSLVSLLCRSLCSFFSFASAGFILCRNKLIPLERARSIEELDKTRFVDYSEASEIEYEDHIIFAKFAWDKYMERYGHLPFVQAVISTLDKSSELEHCQALV